MIEFFLGYFTALILYYLFDVFFIGRIIKYLNRAGLVKPPEFTICYEEARVFYFFLQQRDRRNEECYYSQLIQDLSEYLSEYRNVESSGFNLW